MKPIQSVSVLFTAGTPAPVADGLAAGISTNWNAPLTPDARAAALRVHLQCCDNSAGVENLVVRIKSRVFSFVVPTAAIGPGSLAPFDIAITPDDLQSVVLWSERTANVQLSVMAEEA